VQFFGVCDDEYKIDLADISLSETDKCTLLKTVQKVYGKDVQQLRITNKREVSDYHYYTFKFMKVDRMAGL
jgi:hypothetical protein